MTALEQLNARIRELVRIHATPALVAEIEYHLEIDREDDELDLYSILRDIEDCELDNQRRHLLTPLRKIGIDLGVWEHLTTERLARIQMMGGRRKYDFKLAGKCYGFNKHPAGSR